MSRIALLLILLLTAACAPKIEYASGGWDRFVSDDRCHLKNPADPEGLLQGNRLPHFLITSRLPDCQNANIGMTIQRAEGLRYGRYSIPAETGKRSADKLAVQSLEIAFQPRGQWWSEVTRRAQQNDGQVMIYIHGFNEPWVDPASRMARIAHVSGFKGPMIYYGWPSHGKLLRFSVDENNQEFDRDNLAAILRDLSLAPQVREITVVAHSLGTRLAINAIDASDKMLTKRPGDPQIKTNTIILASADLDRQLFERRLSYDLFDDTRKTSARHVTAYVSRKDQAVDISHSIHGLARVGNPTCDDPDAATDSSGKKSKSCYPQFPANQNGIRKRVTIVDTTEVSKSRAGHSDYVLAPEACADLVRVITGQPAAGRTAVDQGPAYVQKLVKGAAAGKCERR